MRKDSSRAFAKLAHSVEGAPRIVSEPPLIVPVEDLVSAAAAKKFEGTMHGVLDRYVETLPLARRRVIGRYRYAHAARKLVGVGSVGTRAWVVMMLGRDENDPLFLQAKEAQPSVLSAFAGKSEFSHEGQRVVEGQRLMQSASDIALGWVTTEDLADEPRDFYVRQLWDWKVSADIEIMTPGGMAAYARLCGWTLARAHACSGDAATIAGYLGSGTAFDRAITAFAEAYADQNERDHAALVQAIDEGRVDAAPNI